MTHEEFWAIFKERRERDARLKETPVGAAFLAYEQALFDSHSIEMRIEQSASGYICKATRDRSEAALAKTVETRDALVAILLGEAAP
jgi:hypothetical protein